MKKTTILFSLLFSCICINAQKTFQTEGDFLKNQYLPSEEQSVDFDITVIKPDGTAGKVKLSSLPIVFAGKNLDLLKNLPHVTTSVIIKKITTSGGITYATAGLSGKNETYEVAVSYIQYNNYIDVANGVAYKYGLSMRMVANITTKEGGIDLGSLFAIGFSAKRQKVIGSLIYKSSGMTSKEIQNLIPLPSEISPSSIQTCIQAIALIKAKLLDAETVLTPVVIEIKNEKPEARTKNDLLQFNKIN